VSAEEYDHIAGAEVGVEQVRDFNSIEFLVHVRPRDDVLGGEVAHVFGEGGGGFGRLVVLFEGVFDPFETTEGLVALLGDPVLFHYLDRVEHGVDHLVYLLDARIRHRNRDLKEFKILISHASVGVQ